MVFRSPLERLALRLGILGSRLPESGLSEGALELVLYLHLGAAAASAIALIVAGVGVALSIGAGVAAFLALSLGLLHPVARWGSAAVGTAILVGLGLFLGGATGKGALGTTVGVTAGLVVSGVVYGPLVVSAARTRAARRAPRP